MRTSKNTGSKKQPLDASDETGSSPIVLKKNNAEAIEALKVILTAFVDLGFGTSSGDYASLKKGGGEELNSLAEKYTKRKE